MVLAAFALLATAAAPHGAAERQTLQAGSSSGLLSQRSAVLLASDEKYASKCLATAASLRANASYSGAIVYATIQDRLSADQLADFRRAGVSVADLQTIITAANPGSTDGYDAMVARLPRSCDFSLPADVSKGGIVNGPGGIVKAQKRAAGWLGYYYKALATSTSYWSDLYDRILYVDCGAEALAAPVADFFDGIDSEGKLLAVADTDEFPGSEQDLGLVSQFRQFCNETAYGELVGGYSSHAMSGPYFNSAFMLFDTALLGTRNSALHAVTSLYHTVGVLAEGDQSILNLYWVRAQPTLAETPKPRLLSAGCPLLCLLHPPRIASPPPSCTFGPLRTPSHERFSYSAVQGATVRDVWEPLPWQRTESVGECFYDYFNCRNGKGCESYLLVKMADAAFEGRAGRGCVVENATRRLS